MLFVRTLIFRHYIVLILFAMENRNVRLTHKVHLSAEKDERRIGIALFNYKVCLAAVSSNHTMQSLL